MTRMLMTWRALVLAAMVALMGATIDAPTADAGQMLFRARGFEDPPSAAAARTEKTGTNHKYVQVDYPGTGSEVCSTVHFTPFTDYPDAGNISISFNYTTSGTSTNASRWRADLGCVGAPLINATCTGSGTPRACCTGSGTGNCNNYSTITLSPGTTFTVTPGSGAAANVEQHSTYFSSALDETGCTSISPMVLKLCRNPADGSDTNTDTLSLTDFLVTW